MGIIEKVFEKAEAELSIPTPMGSRQLPSRSMPVQVQTSRPVCDRNKAQLSLDLFVEGILSGIRAYRR